MPLIKASIKNFQSLADVEIDFSPSTTAITGANDTGKSAAIRAIKTVITNSFRPVWVTHGKTSASVELVFDDCVVRWGRKSNSNYYELEQLNSEPRKFAKIGRSVPEEIEKVLNFGFIDIDDHRRIPLNIAGQWDSPFLVSESGSVVSQVLGKISGIDVVYSVLKAVASSQSEYKRQLNDLNKTIDDQKLQLEKAIKRTDTIKDNLDGIDAVVSQIGTRETKYLDLSAKSSKLKDGTDIVDRLKLKLKYLPSEAITSNMEETGKKLQKIATLQRHLSALQYLISTKKKYTAQLKSIIELTDVSLEPVDDKIKHMAACFATFESLNKLRTSLNGIDRRLAFVSQFKLADTLNIDGKLNKVVLIKEFQSKIRTLAQNKVSFIENIQDLKTRQENCKIELNEFKSCPLCGGGLDHETI